MRCHTAASLTEPLITPRVARAIDDTRAYFTKRLEDLKKQPGHPIRQLAFAVSTIAVKPEYQHLTVNEICHLEEEHQLSAAIYNDKAGHTLIALAEAGDVDADIVLRRQIAARMGQEELPPSLIAHAKRVVLDEFGPPRPRHPRLMGARDFTIAMAVHRLIQQGFRATRNRKEPKGRPAASACWIVAQALGELKLERSVAAIEQIWNRTTGTRPTSRKHKSRTT